MSNSPNAPLSATLKLTELTGDKREMILQDRGLPYRGLAFKGDQRVNVTYLPGSPWGTATVLGPTEAPTSMHGCWKDKYFGQGNPPCMRINNRAVLSVKDAEVFMDSFRRLGQLIKFSWAHIIRLGFIKSFEHTWDNEHDVVWSVDFEWISQGDQQQPLVPAGGPDMAGLASAMRQRLDALDDVPLPRGFGLSTGFLTSIQNFQHNLEDLVFKVEDTVVSLTDQLMVPVRAARGILTTLRGIQGECEDLIGFVRGQVSGEVNASTPVQEQSFSQRLEAEAFSREMQDWAQELRREAIEQQQDLAAKVNYDVIALYTVKQGDDLRSISAEFYGTPNEWRRIMIYNGLDSMSVTVGTILQIPSISQLSEADGGAA